MRNDVGSSGISIVSPANDTSFKASRKGHLAAHQPATHRLRKCIDRANSPNFGRSVSVRSATAVRRRAMAAFVPAGFFAQWYRVTSLTHRHYTSLALPQ
jgi:hypothetical protein